MAPREQLLIYFPHGKAATQYPINYCKPQTVHGNTDLLLQWNRKVAQKVDACLSATTDSIKWSALWSNNGSSLQTTHHCSAEDITSNELLWCAERRERSMEVSTWELCPPHHHHRKNDTIRQFSFEMQTIWRGRMIGYEVCTDSGTVLDWNHHICS